MAKEIIAADYDNVKVTLAKMDKEIDEMVSAMKMLDQAIESTTSWKGIDALEYKLVLKRFESRISNSLRWLNSLDDIISKHSYSLYKRALEDQKTSTFR